ncbi:MAG TPA: hypothetical protein PKL31_08435 [Fulvivirga sp.]|nr:hypothetical protein [Fulvivirga sp.]
MQKYYKSFVALAAVGVITAIIFYLLGGGQELKFELLTKDITVYGKSFIGKYDDPATGKLFEEAKNHVLSNPNETIAVVSYHFDHEDSVKQFIGFVSNKIYDLPKLEMKEVTFIKTKLEAHALVMPNPHDVKEKAQEFAAQKGLKLDIFSIELYHAERDLEVLFPCKAN